MTDPSDIADDRAQPPLPRRSVRVAVDAQVSIRRGGEKGYQAKALNVSLHGCKIQFAVRPQAGDQMWVKFEGLEPLEAVVRHVEQTTAGLEFKKPIHPAVFDLLLARLQSPGRVAPA